MVVSARACRLAAWVLALALGAPAGAQEVYSYTHLDTGPNRLPLGYPVPEPVASLTPVDGFRDYDNLHARHQQLALEHDFISAHVVGQSLEGRDIWAYVISAPGELTPDGRPRPAFQITGAVHAREWQSPEVVTGIMERFAARAGEDPLYRYLVENARIVVIPALNPDGLLQTQRYPAGVIVGADPGHPEWPRDGRMRRKNMRLVDHDLLTFDDHLLGVDLNRNNPPRAPAPPPGASANRESLVFHGHGPFTEPETQALEQATTLAPAERLRLYTDFHSFGAVFFDELTSNTRRNRIQERLVDRAIRTLRGVGAEYSRDPTGPDLGSTDEYFALVHQVPSWTLEIEPDMRGAGAQYGGFGATHDGFILPDREIARVREQIADAYAMLFYAQAGPPAVREVQVLDDSGDAVFAAEWRRDGPDRRRRVVTANRPLRTDTDYTLWVTFDKPMRASDGGGRVSAYPGMNAPLVPDMRLAGEGVDQALPGRARDWLSEPAGAGSPGYLRYPDDAYAVAFQVADPGDGLPARELTLRISARDLAENALDADPATVVDWSGGRWIGYESAAGVQGDTGGADATTSLRVLGKNVARVTLSADAASAPEGSRVTLVLERDLGADGFEVRLDAERVVTDPEPVATPLFQTAVAFAPDGEKRKELGFTMPDDLEVASPAATEEVRITASVEGPDAVIAPPDTVSVAVEDNDAPGRLVINVMDRFPHPLSPGASPLPPGLALGARLADALKAARSAPGPVTVNLEDGGFYSVREAREEATGFPAIEGDVRIRGRNTVIARHLGDGSPEDFRLFRVATGARLHLQGVILEGGRLTGGRAGGAVLNEGRLAAHDVVFRDNAANRAGALNNRGEAVLVNTRLVDNASTQGGGAVFNAGSMRLSAVTLSGNRTEGRGGGILNAGELEVADSTFLDNAAAAGADLATAGAASVAGSVLGSGNACAVAGAGTLASEGHNINPDASCGLNAPGDFATPEAGLLALDDHGLHRPLPESPVVDGGRTDGCIPADARGAPRPFSMGIGAAACDVGAVEHGLSVHRGMWWNPARPGHGIELQQARNLLVLTWFTFEPDGTPAWYQASGPFTSPTWEAALLRYTFSHDDMQASPEAAGNVRLSFQGPEAATFEWDLEPLGQGRGSEPFEPLRPVQASPRLELTAHWAAADLTGWGLTVDTQGDVNIATLYYYDAAGKPRWVQGVGQAGLQSDMAMDSFTGFCPACPARPLDAAPAGTVSLRFLTRSWALGNVDLTYPGEEGGEWTRQEDVLGTLSDPVP